MTSAVASSSRLPPPSEEDDFKPYVPLSQRRSALLAKLASKGGKEAKEAVEREDEIKEKEDEEARKREKIRRERTLLDGAKEVKRRKLEQGQSIAVTVTCEKAKLKAVDLAG